MKELILWLAKMEQMSSKVYRSAADIFKEDKELGPLLNQLARDEEWHYHMMRRAMEAFTEEKRQPPILSNWISLHKAKLEAPFLEMAIKISIGTLTRDAVLDYMVASEFSEYNLIFLYVINSLKYSSQEFAYAASKMENHKKSIQHFFESSPDYQNYLRQISALPRVWNTSLLVVEDYEPIRTLLADILEKEGTVETTTSGNMGLKKVTMKFYDLILTDMTTPTMSAIQFYKQAVQRNPLIAERFMFLLNAPTEEEVNFIKNNNIDYIEKPFSVEQIQNTVHEILIRQTQKRKLREAI
jgi:CheY-like chemotaxis protein